MKRNISELMDDYPAELTEFIDLHNDTPLSQSKIKELTMNKITNKKLKPHRNMIRIAVIAASLAVFSVSAFAVSYILGAGESFQNFFAKNGNNLTSEQLEIMDNVGRTFEQSVTSNGTTITPIAALADENVYYLKLRIEAPADVVLPDYSSEEGYYQLFGSNQDESMDLNLDSYQYPGYDSEFEWLQDENPTDNVKEVVIIFHAMPGTDLKFNDNVSKQLTIRGLWLQSPDKEYTQILDGEFNFDISLHYDEQTIPLDCNGLIWRDETQCTITLKELKLSPLSLSYQYEVTGSYDEESVEYGVGPCEICFVDGTTTKLEVAYGNEGSGYFLFDEPLDLTQVDCIKYGDKKIPIR